MHILFIFNNVYFFRYYDGVVRELRKRGHRVSLLVGAGSVSRNYSDRALQACVAETGAECQELRIGQVRLWQAKSLVRELAGYANYFRPGHPARDYAAKWAKYLSPRTSQLLEKPFVRWWLSLRSARLALRAAERLVPQDRFVRRWLKENHPDVVVATPFVFPAALDVEYVKAALSLRIPAIVAVGSWDHPAGKGVFPIMPDVALVWNEEMQRDLMLVHDVPAGRILITGAPSFDFWFEARPLASRVAFCQQAGLDPSQPFAVYLCSSGPIAGTSEPDLVRKIAVALSKQTQGRPLHVLVRPYPAMGHVWRGFQAPHVTIWPPEGEWPDVPGAKQNLYHSLYYSAAVAGVNTTAMLEAAVVDRPCLTIMLDQLRGSQTGRSHFRQLLEGQFLDIATDVEQAASVLVAMRNGCDSKGDQRRVFVQHFLRPRGRDRAVRQIVADVIEMGALRTSVEESEGTRSSAL